MKSTDLMTFENPTIGTIRGFIDKNGEPWFLAAQVCRCLGIKNSAKAVADLKQRMQVVEDWYKSRAQQVSSYSPKQEDNISNLSVWGITSSYSPKQEDNISNLPKAHTITLQEGKTHTQLTVIPEQWLYELIFASRKQTAIVFRAWVTCEVLPALRKHGEYRMKGKLIRRSLTDTIKEEIVDKTNNENVRRFSYSNFSRLINKSLGLPNVVDRDSLPSEILEKLARRENLVQSIIAEGKSYNEVKAFIINGFMN